MHELIGERQVDSYTGRKQILGLHQGASENQKVCDALFGQLGRAEPAGSAALHSMTSK